MIRVLPFDQVGRRTPPVGPAGADPLGWAAHREFLPSGRSALDAVLRSLALQADDEVLVTNSSGQTYISPCVTCTVFNHCQPSRVTTDRTRAIVAIHEHGYPHPELTALRAAADDHGIPLIEDCAHSIDSSVGGVPLGAFGDFAIFSLAKVLPIENGGILVSAGTMPDLPSALIRAGGQAQAHYVEHLPAVAEYSRRRRENADAIHRSFPDLPLLLGPGPGVTPFYVGLLTPDAPWVKERSSVVEWGSTLREDLLLVTTNPFVESGQLVAAVQSAFALRDVA